MYSCFSFKVPSLMLSLTPVKVLWPHTNWLWFGSHTSYVIIYVLNDLCSLQSLNVTLFQMHIQCAYKPSTPVLVTKYLLWGYFPPVKVLLPHKKWPSFGSHPPSHLFPPNPRICLRSWNQAVLHNWGIGWLMSSRVARPLQVSRPTLPAYQNLLHQTPTQDIF